MPASILHSTPNIMNSQQTQKPKEVIEEAWRVVWREYIEATPPFLTLPPEIILKVFKVLNPIDSTCLSLVKYVAVVYLFFTSFPLMPS